MYRSPATLPPRDRKKPKLFHDEKQKSTYFGNKPPKCGAPLSGGAKCSNPLILGWTCSACGKAFCPSCAGAPILENGRPARQAGMPWKCDDCDPYKTTPVYHINPSRMSIKGAEGKKKVARLVAALGTEHDRFVNAVGMPTGSDEYYDWKVDNKVLEGSGAAARRYTIAVRSMQTELKDHVEPLFAKEWARRARGATALEVAESMGGPSGIVAVSIAEGIVEWDQDQLKFVAGPLMMETASGGSNGHSPLCWAMVLVYAYQYLLLKENDDAFDVPDICRPRCGHGVDLAELLASSQQGLARTRGRRNAPNAPAQTRIRRLWEAEVEAELPNWLARFQNDELYDVALQAVDGHKTKITGWVKLGSGKGSATDHIREQTDLYAAFVFLRQFVGEPAPDEDAFPYMTNKCYHAIEHWLCRTGYFRVINGCAYRLRWKEDAEDKDYECLEIATTFAPYDPAGKNMGMEEIPRPPRRKSRRVAGRK